MECETGPTSLLEACRPATDQQLQMTWGLSMSQVSLDVTFRCFASYGDRTADRFPDSLSEM